MSNTGGIGIKPMHSEYDPVLPEGQSYMTEGFPERDERRTEIVSAEPPRGRTAEDINELARKDNDRLEKFLAASRRAMDTANVYIKSIDTTLVVRELNEREMEDAISAQADLRKRAANPRFISAAANVVSKAIMEPNFGDPQVMAKFQEIHGPHITSVAEIVKLVLKPLEILSVLEEIMALSGGDDDAVQVAKN